VFYSLNRIWVTLSFPSNGYRALLPGTKQPGCESDRWHLSSAKCKNVGTCTSTYLHLLQALCLNQHKDNGSSFFVVIIHRFPPLRLSYLISYLFLGVSFVTIIFLSFPFVAPFPYFVLASLIFFVSSFSVFSVLLPSFTYIFLPPFSHSFLSGALFSSFVLASLSHLFIPSCSYLFYFLK
jgi:hypothetical protein